VQPARYPPGFLGEFTVYKKELARLPHAPAELKGALGFNCLGILSASRIYSDAWRCCPLLSWHTVHSAALVDLQQPPQSILTICSPAFLDPDDDEDAATLRVAVQLVVRSLLPWCCQRSRKET
jgi:hypothetical protein